MRPDENRIVGDRKTPKASGPEVVDEEIYLIPGRYKWGKKLEEKERENRRLAQLQNALNYLPC